MNSEYNPPNQKEFSEQSETNNTLSINEFFKHLEEKEKALEISSDLIIEIEESDVTEEDISEFLQINSSDVQNERKSATAAFENNSYKPTNNSNFQTQISILQNQIARLETERNELYELARRQQNDFDSFKNRTERERSETFRNQLSNLATQMLPVVDNLNRAMDLSNGVAKKKSQNFQQFFEGIVLVSQQLNEVLAEMGVQPIVAVGERFDPHYHEAVAAETTDKYPAQTVTSELLRGYRIGDKVIRPSMVKVSVSATTGNLPDLTAASGNGFSQSE